MRCVFREINEFLTASDPPGRCLPKYCYDNNGPLIGGHLILRKSEHSLKSTRFRVDTLGRRSRIQVAYISIFTKLIVTVERFFERAHFRRLEVSPVARTEQDSQLLVFEYLNLILWMPCHAYLDDVQCSLGTVKISRGSLATIGERRSYFSNSNLEPMKVSELQCIRALKVLLKLA